MGKKVSYSVSIRGEVNVAKVFDQLSKLAPSVIGAITTRNAATVAAKMPTVHGTVPVIIPRPASTAEACSFVIAQLIYDGQIGGHPAIVVGMVSRYADIFPDFEKGMLEFWREGAAESPDVVARVIADGIEKLTGADVSSPEFIGYTEDVREAVLALFLSDEGETGTGDANFATDEVPVDPTAANE